jgi:hypothetical protein
VKPVRGVDRRAAGDFHSDGDGGESSSDVPPLVLSFMTTGGGESPPPPILAGSDVCRAKAGSGAAWRRDCASGLLRSISAAAALAESTCMGCEFALGEVPTGESEVAVEGPVKILGALEDAVEGAAASREETVAACARGAEEAGGASGTVDAPAIEDCEPF